jgi:hypothetical protein
MALTISDRIKETSSTTGTGTYTLAGAVIGFETFTANLSNSDTTYYCCTDNTDFEVGLGTFTTSGTTLARTTILASSNSNNAVSWGAGTRTVFCTLPAAKTIVLDASGNASVGGTITATGVTLGDAEAILLGDSADLQISHTGSYSLISDSGTGNLILACQDFQLTNPSVGENMITATVDGAVTLYHDNGAKLATTSTGIDVTGTVTSTGTSVFASLDISGDIDVDGTTNLDVVDIDGAVNMATTALVTGVLTANGGAVFNEAGADVDFRVESDTIDHALFVDGANGNVGIGTASPSELLSLYQASGDPAIKIQSSAGLCYVVNRAGTLGMDLLNAMNGPMTFGTNNINRMTITSAGGVEMATTLQVDGVATFTGRDIHSDGITIANAGQIGSVGDLDAIAIASNGVVTFSQIPVLPANSIDSDAYVDGSIDTAHIANLQITTGLIAADAITAAKIADDVIDSEHYAAGSIDTEHIADANVTLAKIANQAANTVLVRDANSSGVVSAKAVATTQILIGNGTGFTVAALSGDVTMTNAGVVTIAATSVEGSMLNTNVISGQTELASGLALTDELLVSDAGVLKRMDVSVLTAVTDDNATALAIALG